MLSLYMNYNELLFIVLVNPSLDKSSRSSQFTESQLMSDCDPHKKQISTCTVFISVCYCCRWNLQPWAEPNPISQI